VITFSVESIDECLEDMRHLWMVHWEEIALDKDKIALEPDVDTFYALEHAGALQIVVARDEAEQVVGYHVSVVRRHLHYRSSLTAYVDMYFVHPEHRRGRAGIKLFLFAEQALRERGVQRIYTGTKLHKDVGRLLDFIGHKEIERLYVKSIGD
jgi:GNAT superfamily N-acetyltransferase